MEFFGKDTQKAIRVTLTAGDYRVMRMNQQ
jgi:hypothetical protein